MSFDPVDPDTLPTLAGRRSREATACIRLAKARGVRSWNRFPQWGWVWRADGDPYLVMSRSGTAGPGSVGAVTPLTTEGILSTLRLFAFGYGETLGPVSELERLQVCEAVAEDLQAGSR